MKTNVLKTTLLSVVSSLALTLGLAVTSLAAQEPDGDNDQAHRTSENFLRLDVRPIFHWAPRSRAEHRADSEFADRKYC